MANVARDDTAESGSPKFRIGAVSKLTQIPVDTLRAWERRYSVVAPGRADSSARLYSEDDVERLKLIKRLVDRDHAIGSIASLRQTELEALLALHQNTSPAAPTHDREVASVTSFGKDTLSIDAAQMATNGITVLGQYTDWVAFESAVTEHQPDALVIEVGALMQDQVRDILRLGWRSVVVRTIVIYGFASSALVGQLIGEGLIVLRSPVSHDQLMRELGRASMSAHEVIAETPMRPAPRMFEDKALSELARLATAVQCECPHHLVDIIHTLTQFEFYSAECEHRSEKDAKLHAKLRVTAAHARGLFERALLEVVEHEGIPLPAGVREFPV